MTFSALGLFLLPFILTAFLPIHASSLSRLSRQDTEQISPTPFPSFTPDAPLVSSPQPAPDNYKFFPKCEDQKHANDSTKLHRECSLCHPYLMAYDQAMNDGISVNRPEGCPSGCCVNYNIDAENTEHLLTCYQGCCTRIVRMKQGDLSIKTMITIPNERTQSDIDETTGRCTFEEKPSSKCGQTCAFLVNDPGSCESRRTVGVPEIGTEMVEPGCSIILPDPQNVESGFPDPSGDGEGEGEGGRRRRQECFPADGMVEMQGGHTKTVEELVVGDIVRVGVEEHSTVIGFTHRLRNGYFEFMEIVTGENDVLRLSRGHYIYVEDKLRKAEDVQPRDRIIRADGSFGIVQRVNHVRRRGLFNPQTAKGDIIVDGILVSTYTDAVPSTCAHALLAPVRFAVNVLVSWDIWGVSV